MTTTSAITRSQISSTIMGVNMFMVSGNTTPGDSGVGGIYIIGTSGGEDAIQDAGGTWYNLLTEGQFFSAVLQQYSVDNSTSASTVLTAANIFGGLMDHTLAMTGAITVASNAQLPTVSSLLALIGNAVTGQTFRLRIINQNGSASGAWTLINASDTSWTLNGSMVIPVGSWTDFIITLTSMTAASIQFDGVSGSGTGNVIAVSSPTSGQVAIWSSSTGIHGSATLPITAGGTGQATALAGFNALSPMAHPGDILYGGTSGSALVLAAGTSEEVLIGGPVPSWGVPPVLSTGITDATSIGVAILTAVNAAAVLSDLGGTTLGVELFEATSTSAAQGYLGASTLGKGLFTAASAAAALVDLGVSTLGALLFDAPNGPQALTDMGVQTIGQELLVAASAAAAVTVLGGTTVGNNVLTAATQALAQTALGATTIGAEVFTAPDTATAQAAIGIMGTIASLNLVTGNHPGVILGGSASTAAITITSGACSDSTKTTIIQSTGQSWAVSNGNQINGFDGGTSLPGSSTIHFFICQGASGVGSFASTSLTPTCPTGYNTAYRRIFSMNTTAAGILIPVNYVSFSGGETVYWLQTQTLDISTTALGASQVLYTLNVPLGIKVTPIIRANSDTANASIILTSGDEGDVAPANGSGTPWTAAPGMDINGAGVIASPFLTTNASGQIGARAYASATHLYLVTRGWRDPRRS